ncbi:MAG: DUF5827 family protein [Natrialbaceae archaeon]|nr:DUF5827 family protein [Natrialbaceae archaeon]
MPRPKETFESILPCEFYTPAELLDAEPMYTIDEIARLLQGLEPDATIQPETEAILREWAIPWVMAHADDLVIADPTDRDEPGYYGLA